MSDSTQHQSKFDNGSVLTIGTFDGVHVGHKKILQKVVNKAKALGLPSVVLTLFPHPRMVLFKDETIKLLNTIDERISILNEAGIEHVMVKKFSKSFSNLSGKQYVKDILVEELNAKHIVIGYDHHFGKNRSANINDLKQFANTYNFVVEEISAQDIEDVTVSSTKIRNALDIGDVALANAYLGYRYFITGKVIKGKRIGRTIDFPTANIDISEDYKLIPKDGVYVISSIIDNVVYYGMMNIGTNPTVEGKNRSVEVHFFDFSANLYGEILKVEFLSRLRDENKYNDLNALKKQLKIDEQQAKDYISSL